MAMSNEPVALGTLISGLLVATLGVANAIWHLNSNLNSTLTVLIVSLVALVGFVVRSKVTPVDGPYVQALKDKTNP